ncbi:sensor histidine kinase [Syntrophorhabdus aromaticivorans]|uniref:histidine kinase n=1 Tax=Syntrophorhabdus aromaticivorans TaxID=328301 RepID=A0A971M1Z8_9BACT|nr:ATP-binding protein [Syntrophorhabdus aromaticivorans]NLW34283.1 two-component sensor histidine kinase [Syntrophorhabdus aromaticivorans]
MEDSGQSEDKRQRALEVTLEEEKSISRARNAVLLANIKELNEVYDALREKLKELRHKDERIRGFEAELVRANKLSALGELAGSIAHEIKNPLISIQGFARRIEQTGDREKVERYAKFIEKEADRLSQVLARLLAFSRMEEPRADPVNMNDIVDDTVLFMEHHLTRFKSVEVVVEKEPNLVPVRADRIHIQQTVVNIVMNAAQAMPDGGKIRISTGRDDTHVFISIADTGTGIKEEDLDRIFEPFFTTKDRGEGTGLGLSLCKKLIEANHGRIEVESKAGEGAIFKIMIPVHQA